MPSLAYGKLHTTPPKSFQLVILLLSNVKALLFLCHWQRMPPRKNASKKREIPSATKKQMTNSEVNMEPALLKEVAVVGMRFESEVQDSRIFD
ncbi:hypothetical protein EMCRGX_G005187 [Ephydatia muelleri]